MRSDRTPDEQALLDAINSLPEADQQAYLKAIQALAAAGSDTKFTPEEFEQLLEAARNMH